MYAAYDFYRDSYGGSQILPDDWPLLARQVDAYIDLVTYGRLQRGAPVTDAVRMAACAAAEVQQAQQKAGRTAGVQSESVGSQSVTYENAEEREKRESAELMEAIDLHLPPWDPLRYAGVR